MLSVETDLAGKVMEGSREDIINFMEGVGYKHLEHSQWNLKTNKIKDDLFVRRDLIEFFRLTKADLRLADLKTEREEL